jgi:tetratricopeptide (TPR) repeat protein
MEDERINRLWDFGDPAATEARFAEVLGRADYAPGTAARAELLTQIARSQGLQRKFEEARRTIGETAGLIASLGDAANVARIRWHLERGRIDNSSTAGDRGRADFRKALDLATAAGEENLACDAAHMMAIIEPPDAALEWSARAIAMAEAANSEKAKNWLGPLYHNTGWTYHDRMDFPKALEFFEKALAFRTERKQDGEIRIAKWTIARCLRSMGRIEEALARQRALQAEFEAARKTDGFVYEELGECLLALDRAPEARSWFAKAHAELSKDDWLAAHEKPRLDRLAELGKPE